MLLSAIKTIPVAKRGIQPKGPERCERWESFPEGRRENVFWRVTLGYGPTTLPLRHSAPTLARYSGCRITKQGIQLGL